MRNRKPTGRGLEEDRKRLGSRLKEVRKRIDSAGIVVEHSALIPE